MPHYIILVNFTDQGIRNIRELPTRIPEVDSRLEAAGIKLTRYFTMGQYDAVVVVEAPSDEVGIGALLAIGSMGNIRTTTMRAFTQEEFLRIAQGLPPA